MEVSAEEYRKMKADPNYKPKRPHKHAELIKAWADGAEIQVRPTSKGNWDDASRPGWYEDFEYRIKPITIRYRVALWKPQNSITPDKIVPIIVTWEENCQQPREHWDGFIRWLTDWIEVEV